MGEREIRAWLIGHGVEDDARYPGHVLIRQQDIPDALADEIEEFLLRHHAHWEPLDPVKAARQVADLRPGEEAPTIGSEPWGWWVLPMFLEGTPEQMGNLDK